MRGEANESPKFLSAAAVLRAVPEASRSRLFRWALSGVVRTEIIPGMSPRYHVEDVRRAAAGYLATA